MSPNDDEGIMRMTPGLLATACIPWHDDYTFAEDLFRQEVRFLLGAGATHLYIFGTAGEGYAVTDAQFAHIARVFYAEVTAGGGQPQLGVIGLSVPQVNARIAIGLEIGYTAFQISLPSWGAVNDRELYGFFDAVLGAHPRARFLHYNLLRGLRIVKAREYARIAADHPNLVATKTVPASLRDLISLVQDTPEICHFTTELSFAYASLFGPCGLLVSLTGIHFPKAQALFAAGQRRDAEALVALASECRAVLDLILASVASGQHMDGAYDKLYVKLALPDFPLCLLPPYAGATDEEYAAFREQLHAQFPSWVPQRDH